jgi:hypothetical protein
MAEIPKALNQSLAATIGEKKYAIFTDRHCAVIKAAPECFAPTLDYNPAPIVRAAQSAAVVVVDRSKMQAFVRTPCRDCDDVGYRTCPTCSGSGRARRSCRECGRAEHECSCQRIGCEEGKIRCECSEGGCKKLGRILSCHYDLRLLRVVLRGLPTDGEISVGESDDSSGRGHKMLVLRCGDDIGVVMECNVYSSVEWPEFALIGASA